MRSVIQRVGPMAIGGDHKRAVCARRAARVGCRCVVIDVRRGHLTGCRQRAVFLDRTRLRTAGNNRRIILPTQADGERLRHECPVAVCNVNRKCVGAAVAGL